MPIRKLAKVYPHAAESQKLRDELIAEWQHPSGNDQPVIIEDGGGSRPIHVYVIWDNWAPLDQIERSEVIMEAYDQIHGTPASLEVTVAMGLTPIEAQRLGISYT